MGYAGMILSVLAQRVPMILVLVAGLVFAIVRREHHPRISLLAGIYFGGSIILSALGALTGIWPVLVRETYGLSYKRIGALVSVAGIVLTLLQAALTVLLIYAIFGGRADLDDED